MFERWAWRSEKFGASFRYVQIVLQAYAELTGNVNARFVAEDHPGLQCRIRRPPVHVALYEVAPFVHFHSEPVADPVREVLEARTVAAIYDDPAGCRVHNLIRNPWFCRFERRLLRLLHDPENLSHLVSRLAQHKRPGDVGRVAFHA